MNAISDRPTPVERQGAQDCLVELATRWLQQPFADMTESARGEAIEEMCLLIAQMRHRETRLMDLERRRWIERVAVRLCQQVPGMRGHEGAVQVELERRTTMALITFHNWRESHALPLPPRPATGGNEVTA